MKEIIIAIGLLFFIEGLFLAIFPSRIKNMLEVIKNTPENKLRFFGLFLFIEGILYALFPSRMKNMLKKLDLLKDNQLRTGGLIFVFLGFIIIYYLKTTT